MSNEQNLEEMHFVTAEEIDAASDVVIEAHYIKEFGGYVRIRSLDTDQTREMGKLMDLAEKKGKTFDATTWLAAQFMVKEDGTPMMTPGQLKAKKRNVRGLRRVNAIGQHLSGMTVEALEEMKSSLKQDPTGDSPAESLSQLEFLLD